MNPAEPTKVISGTWVRLESIDDGNREELAELDWKRAQAPEMGGWFARPQAAFTWGTMLFRSIDSGPAAGVVDAVRLSGYADVANVSLFADAKLSPPGWAMDAYGLFVARLFGAGVRLIHHEVLEINRPVQRILRGIDVSPTARLRQHGYAAGRWCDVLIYSYDEEHWNGVLSKFGRRRVGRPVERKHN